MGNIHASTDMSRGKSTRTAKRVGKPLGRLTPTTDFARRLHHLFPDPNLSALARSFGVGAGAVRRYLTGEAHPDVGVLARIVRATGCDANWLLTGQAIKPQPSDIFLLPSDERRRKRGKPLGDMTPKTELAQRLQEVLGLEGFDQTGEKIGVKRDTVVKYLRGVGRPPTADVLRRIVEATDCEARWLLTGEGRPFPQQTVSQESPGEIIQIPLAGRAAADDSGGTYVEFEHEGEPLGLPAHTFHVQVQGNSMAPLARDGQSVFVDCGDRLPRDGEFVVVQTSNGRTYFKRYFDEGEDVYLVSFNPVDQQKPIRLSKGQLERVCVVVGVWFG